MSDKAKFFYLQNVTAGFCGNSPMWWSIGGNGYTPRLDDAEKMTAAEVKSIVQSTRGSHKWKRWPVKLVDKFAHRQFDVQDAPVRNIVKRKVASP